MNGHGGKRPGAGRPKKWSFEVILRVGQACENKWRDEVARAFDAASAKMFGFDADLVALWEAVQKVPLGERRAWLSNAKLLAVASFGNSQATKERIILTE